MQEVTEINSDSVNQSVSNPMIQTEKPKSNFLVILLFVLLTLSVLVAGFFAYQTQKLISELRIKNKEPNATPIAEVTLEPTSAPIVTIRPEPARIPSVTPDPTASWNSYENKQFGFSFKYPKYLEQEIIQNQTENYILLTFDNVNFINTFTIKISYGAPLQPKILLDTEPYDRVKIGNYIWDKYMLSADDGLQMEKNSTLYSVIYRSRKDLIYQILSTFKFIN